MDAYRQARKEEAADGAGDQWADPNWWWERVMAKILVIEDDPSMPNLLDALPLSPKAHHLPPRGERGEGPRTLPPGTPESASGLYLKMPEMDGLTALRHIRSLNLNQPVIIYSGAWTPKKEEHVRAIGITETVAKDCSWEHLEEALKACSQVSRHWRKTGCCRTGNNMTKNIMNHGHALSFTL